MAKPLRTAAITKSDLREYLQDHSDFTFELSVLRMLRELGLECEHGGYYEDPVTQKSREFDIRARSTFGRYRVRIAVECKNIRDHFPVLVSCIPRHAQESYHEIAILSDWSGPTPIMFQSRAKAIRIAGSHSFYKQSHPVGKSTVQVGRASDGSIIANDRELYDRWGQCLSSADELVNQAYWDGKDDDDEVEYSAVFPFVVVPNGRLWTVTFDEEGKQLSDPQLSDRCPCFIDKSYEMGGRVGGTIFRLSHLEIATFDGLHSFAETYLTTEEGMERVFPLEGLIEAMGGSVKSDEDA